MFRKIIRENINNVTKSASDAIKPNALGYPRSLSMTPRLESSSNSNDSRRTLASPRNNRMSCV